MSERIPSGGRGIRFCEDCGQAEEVEFFELEDLIGASCPQCDCAGLVLTNPWGIEVCFDPLDELWPGPIGRETSGAAGVAVFAASSGQVAVFTQEALARGVYWTATLDRSTPTLQVSACEERGIVALPANELDFAVDTTLEIFAELGGFELVQLSTDRLVFSATRRPQKTPYTTGALPHEMEVIGVQLEIELRSSLDFRVVRTLVQLNG